MATEDDLFEFLHFCVGDLSSKVCFGGPWMLMLSPLSTFFPFDVEFCFLPGAAHFEITAMIINSFVAFGINLFEPRRRPPHGGLWCWSLQDGHYGGNPISFWGILMRPYSLSSFFFQTLIIMWCTHSLTLTGCLPVAIVSVPRRWNGTWSL